METDCVELCWKVGQHMRQVQARTLEHEAAEIHGHGLENGSELCADGCVPVRDEIQQIRQLADN